MIFSARTLPGTAGPAGAVVARRVAARALVWPVMAALAALAARRGRRVFFFLEMICENGQTSLAPTRGYIRRQGTGRGPLMPL